jgi:aspartyl protease family protein
VAAPYKQRAHSEVTIVRNAAGMYTTVGSINSLPVDFLVDTGASVIAMNAGHARRLGIDFRLSGQPTMVGTASGITQAYRVILDTVSVGEISARQVPAVVIDGAFPVQVLLGMSFLGQVEIQREGALMRLKKRH